MQDLTRVVQMIAKDSADDTIDDDAEIANTAIDRFDSQHFANDIEVPLLLPIATATWRIPLFFDEVTKQNDDDDDEDC